MTVRVPSRELRNDTAAVLQRVDQGEDVVITVNGRDRARLVPIDSRPRSMNTRRLLAGMPPADPDFSADIRRLVGDETTDDLEW